MVAYADYGYIKAVLVDLPRCSRQRIGLKKYLNPQSRQVFVSPFGVRVSSVSVLLKILFVSIVGTGVW